MAEKPAAEAPAWAFITPSYSGDFRRCQLLCRSMDTFVAGNWHHYLVVDRPDFKQFSVFKSNRRTVLLTDDVMPAGMKLLFHMPFAGGRSVWWSRTAGFQIGWHMQQMVKIGIAAKVTEPGLAYCDSDVFFLRPFDTDGLCRDGKFRLFRTHYKRPFSHARDPAFVRNVLDIFGLPQQGQYYGYIGNFITWRRQSVLDLMDYLAARHGGPWQKAFKGRINISEYLMYGYFVDEVAKDTANIWHDRRYLCRTHWAFKKLSPEAVTALCTGLGPTHVSVGVQSFAGVDVGLLEDQFESAAKAFG